MSEWGESEANFVFQLLISRSPTVVSIREEESRGEELNDRSSSSHKLSVQPHKPGAIVVFALLESDFNRNMYSFAAIFCTNKNEGMVNRFKVNNNLCRSLFVSKVLP